MQNSKYGLEEALNYSLLSDLSRKASNINELYNIFYERIEKDEYKQDDIEKILQHYSEDKLKEYSPKKRLEELQESSISSHSPFDIMINPALDKKEYERMLKLNKGTPNFDIKTIVGLYLSALINKSTVNEFYFFEENNLDYFLYRLDSNKEVMIDRNNGRYVGAKQKGKITIAFNYGAHVGKGQEGEMNIGLNSNDYVGKGQEGKMWINWNMGKYTGKGQKSEIWIEWNEGDYAGEGQEGKMWINWNKKKYTGKGQKGEIWIEKNEGLFAGKGQKGNMWIGWNEGDYAGEGQKGEIWIYLNKADIGIQKGKIYILENYEDIEYNSSGKTIVIDDYKKIPITLQNTIEEFTKINEIIENGEAYMLNWIAKRLEIKNKLSEDEKMILDMIRNKLTIEANKDVKIYL